MFPYSLLLLEKGEYIIVQLCQGHIRLKKNYLGSLFVTHNWRNQKGQENIFREMGMGNCASIMCRAALSTMLSVAFKTIYKLKQNLKIENTAEDENVMVSNEGIKQWEKLVCPVFSEEIKGGIAQMNPADH